ncbi:MAG: hypothetical protein KTR31_01930 [Myxococcales bacterium]|nr:hypothetical protein [Myxococcales bacterium]
MTTWAESLVEEGTQKGRVEGRAEGKAEGKAEGLVHGRVEQILAFVQARFGDVPQAIRALVEGADTAMLDGLTHRIAQAESLEEILQPD